MGCAASAPGENSNSAEEGDAPGGNSSAAGVNCTHKQETESNFEGEDIPGAFLASGAGIPQANGLYVREGTYSGAPLFKNGQLWLLRYTIGSTKFWYIADKDLLAVDDGDLYRVKCPHGLPSLSGWGLAKDGLGPAPRLQSVTDVEGPTGFFVQGAGVPECDGAYQRDGSYASAPLYKQSNGPYWLLRYVLPSGTPYWYIAHKDQLHSNDGDLYRIASPADVPPTGPDEWRLAKDGVAPIPMILPFYPQPAVTADGAPPATQPAVQATYLADAQAMLPQVLGMAPAQLIMPAMPMGTPVNGWASGAAAQPNLVDVCVHLRSELGLPAGGTLKADIDAACEQLGLPLEGTLVEKGKRCWEALGSPAHIQRY